MANERNIAVKEGLDILTDGVDPSLYSQPLQSDGDAIARGLLDENGNATDKGELFLTLQEVGAINPNGSLSAKGHAYSMPLPETFKRENKEAFKIRANDGIDSHGSWEQIPGVLADLGWDAVAGLGRIASADDAPTRGQNLAPLIGISEGFLKNIESLGSLANMGGALIQEQFSKVIGMDKAGEDIVWDARQDMARVDYENQSAKAGAMFDDYVPAAKATETMAKVKSELPPAEYASLLKQTNATGSVVLDPTIIIPAGLGAKAGKAGVTTRLALKAENVIAKTATLDATIASKGVELAALQRTAQTAAQASTVAGKLSESLAARFAATGDQLLAQRANQARDIAERTARAAAAAPIKAAEVSADLAQMTASRTSLATRIPEQAALATQKAIKAGSFVVAAPGKTLVPILEASGNALIYANNQTAKLIEKFGIGSGYKALGVVAGAAGISLGGIPGLATAGAILAAGPVLKSTANFARLVGREMTRARGQVPFWQRVANYADISPIHRGIAHTIDTATAGGAIPSAIKRTAQGAVASYPVFLGFEYLADGGNANADTFKRAAASALVIGGSSAALGGMFNGTKERHRQLALGDELNFRENMTDPAQKSVFTALPPGTRRSLATYSAANPQLNFRFSDTGASSFDRMTNTATVNVTAPNPLKALIAHEVMHNVVIRHQMEGGVSAMLIGDGESGGLLRANDGTLDPNFQKFWDEYNNRNGQKIPMEEAAVEYFVDSSADHVAGMAESGELGSIAGRTNVRRATIDHVIETILPKLPIIKDLHFKLGGLRDAEGRVVMGSGLLADGIRERPEVRRMTREMLRSSAGRSQGSFDPMGKEGKNGAGGATIPIRREDKVLTQRLGVPIFETREVNGRTEVVLDAQGNPKNIDPVTDNVRGNLSNIINESLKTPDLVAPKPNQITLTPEGELSGTFLGPNQIKALEVNGRLNQEQLRMIRNINDTIADFNGSRYNVIYYPAMKKVGKKNRHGSLAPTVRDVVPLRIKVEKSGVLNVELMSVTQLNQNITSRINSKRGKRLYQGDREALSVDLNEVMKLHVQDKGTTEYFNNKYGAQKGPEYKNFANTVFGMMTDSQRTGVIENGVRRDPNPVFEEDKVGYSSNVLKTYRVDRIASATKLSHDLKVPMPFVYDSVKLNLMPLGVPTMDAMGNPVAK